MPESKQWIVTTSPDRPMTEIAKDVGDAGFSVGQVLEEVGIITGAAGPETVSKLRSIKGVVDISPDVPVEIGPPDSPDTW